jgi:hypothetical protein
MAGVRVNRAPVLALWGAVVAERLGTRGWGARGELDLQLLHELAAGRKPAGRR